MPAAIASLIGLIKAIDFHRTLADTQPPEPVAKVFWFGIDLGAGIFLLILSGTALAILAFAMGRERLD